MNAALPLAGAILAASLVGCGSCSSNRRAEVRWPASADVSLASELAATNREALLPEGRRLGDEPLPPDAPNIEARARVFEGLWYAEVRLGEAPEDAPLPLVVMLHGRADRPRIPGGPFGRVPTPMRVLVPRGPLAIGDGYAWARYSVTQVEHHEELARDLIAIAARIVRLVRHVRHTRPTAGTPILTGFSQGAITAWTAALRHPDEVGLVLPIAGWVPSGARPNPLDGAGAPPIRAMHGTADPIVRIEPTRELVGLLERAGYDVLLREFEGVGHTVTPEMNATFEEWLEAAVHERAPELGGGLGVTGPDPEPVIPYETIDEGTFELEAIPAPLPDSELRPEDIEQPEPNLNEGTEENEPSAPEPDSPLPRPDQAPPPETREPSEGEVP